MRLIILLCVCTVTVLSEPEGYKIREPAPVVEKHGLQSVLPPCRHTLGNKFDSNLIQSQSQGRIMNQKVQHLGDNHGENTDYSYAASSPLNQITNGPDSKVSAFTHSYSDGQTLASNSVPVNYIPVSPAISQPQAQGYNGYNYQQQFSSQAIKHNHHNRGPSAFPPPPPPRGHRPPAEPHSQLQVPPFRQNYASYTGQGASSQASSSSNINAQHSSSHFGGFSSPSSSASYSSPDIGLGGHSSSSNYRPQASSYASYTSQFTSPNFPNQHNNAGLASFSSSNQDEHGLNGQLGHVIRETVANAPLDPSADKHIYVHVPPADLERDIESTSLAQQYIPPPAKKHYKIVFIKTPSPPKPNYSHLTAAAAPAVEEKTLIYVLVKKPETPSADDLQQLQQPSYKTSKPEVYFIKYKTQKEGEALQNSPAYASSVTGLSTDQIDLTNSYASDPQIDIRSGGGSSESTKNELSGVPLQ